MRLATLLPTCACLVAGAMLAPHAAADAPAGAGESPSEPAQTATAPERPVEVVEVVGERPVLNEADRRRIYKELATGHRLYADKKIKEAFPYLLNTAERGFKPSQVKVSHIYAYGLGEVERDTSQAVGWLGVAAADKSSRRIKSYFNTIWQRIPEQHVPYFEEVVEEFKGKYGERRTGVVCQMVRPTHSHIKRLGCFFKEDLDKHTLDALDDYFAARARVAEAEAREEEERVRLIIEQRERDFGN